MTTHRATDTDFDAMLEAEKRRRLFRYSPEINSGTIIQILVIVVGMASGYFTLQNAIEVGKLRDAEIERRLVEQDARTAAVLAEVKADVKGTGQQVQDLKSKIDLLDLKVSQPRER